MSSENYSSESSKIKIPVILGPTASGKTGAAIKLAKETGGEVISADSMQIYRGMDIGTAKASEAEMDGVVHHLINIVDPDEAYSVADFREQALAKIDEILSRGKLPIICGGTGLYISSLIYPFDLKSENTDPEVRKRLEQLAKDDPKALYARLQEVDPQSAGAIHPNNLKRIVRALEVYEVSGKPKSQQDREGRETLEVPYDFRLYMPMWDRSVLYERIDARVDEMLNAGLLDETRALLEKYPRDLVSLQAIGYKELYPYLDGETDYDEAVRILKRDTRHFAKRQLTWFRRFEDVHPIGEIDRIDWLAEVEKAQHTAKNTQQHIEESE